MSVPSIVEEICFICKKPSEQTILLSTNQFGSSDLDLRPPEMRRSTMIWWVQECPHCGYVNSNISNPTKIPEGWFTSEEYLSYGGREFVSRLAERFYKQHMIAMMEGNVKTAFFAVLHSAWACDDAGDYDSAVFCRKKALETLDKLYNPTHTSQHINIQSPIEKSICEGVFKKNKLSTALDISNEKYIAVTSVRESKDSKTIKQIITVAISNNLIIIDLYAVFLRQNCILKA